MRTMMLAAVAAVTLASGAQAQRRAVETISYETGPCFGACPVYRVEVSSDGRGVFTGRRFTAVAGERAFRVTPRQYAAFRHRLQALHGHGTVDLTGPPLCEAMATDLPSVEVRWSGRFRAFVLRANYGCPSTRNGWMFPHLRQAPADLPIAGFIGTRGAPRPGR